MSAVQATTERSEKLLGVEAARGIAAILVVFYHAARHMKQDIGYLPMHGISQFGHAGVDFFFVLSGFIIYYVHAADLGQPQRLWHYAQRRFVRIYPFFWCVFLVVLALTLASSTKVFPDLSAILKTFFLVPQHDEPLVGVAWTLEYELTFYALFALAIMNRRLGYAVFAIWLSWIVCINFTVFADVQSTLLQHLGSAFNIEFFFGIGAAMFLRRVKLPWLQGALPLGVLLFLTVGVCENIGWLDGYASPARYAYGLPSFLILLGLVSCERCGNLRRSGHLMAGLGSALVALGSATYAIYLTHLITLSFAYKALGALHLLPILPASLTYLLLCLSAICAGVFLSRCIEHPLMRAVRRGLSKI